MDASSAPALRTRPLALEEGRPQPSQATVNSSWSPGARALPALAIDLLATLTPSPVGQGSHTWRSAVGISGRMNAKWPTLPQHMVCADPM